MLKYKVIGGEANTYNRSVSNDSSSEHISGYIDRIDDENLESSDLLVNAKVTSTSFTLSAPLAAELPTGETFTFQQPAILV